MKQVAIIVIMLICSLLFMGVYYKLIELEADVDAKRNFLEQSIYCRSEVMYTHLRNYNIEEAQKIKDFIDSASTTEDLTKGDRLMCDLWRAEASKHYFDSAILFSVGNRLAVARKEYNDAILAYNEFLQKVPINIIGDIFGFTPKYQYGISRWR